METFTISEIIRYGGWCPNCGRWIEFDQGVVEDDEDDKIVCLECDKMFQIDIINKGEN